MDIDLFHLRETCHFNATSPTATRHASTIILDTRTRIPLYPVLQRGLENKLGFAAMNFSNILSQSYLVALYHLDDPLFSFYNKDNCRFRDCHHINHNTLCLQQLLFQLCYLKLLCSMRQSIITTNSKAFSTLNQITSNLESKKLLLLIVVFSISFTAIGSSPLVVREL
jgi:hypothetical protein